MRKYGKSYENRGLSSNPILRSSGKNPRARDGQVDLHNRGYINRAGAGAENIMQLPRDCSSSPNFSDMTITTLLNADDQTITYTLSGSGVKHIDYWTIDTTTFVVTYRARSYNLVGMWSNLHTDRNLAPLMPVEWTSYNVAKRNERHYKITNLDEIMASADKHWEVHGRFMLWGQTGSGGPTGPELSYEEAIAEIQSYYFPEEYRVDPIAIEGTEVTLPIYAQSMNASPSTYDLYVRAYTSGHDLLWSKISTVSPL